MSEIINNPDQLNDFWDGHYKRNAKPHSHQNQVRSADFLKEIQQRGSSNPIKLTIEKAKTVLDIGCGTGDFCFALGKQYSGKNIMGIDISEEAVRLAELRKLSANMGFNRVDVLNEDLRAYIDKKVDLGYCADMLEHFKDPFAIVDKILEVVDHLIIVVPYNQGQLDGYKTEGGSGHQYRFVETTFDRYYRKAHFLFRTGAWQHVSVPGEVPTQIAYLITK